MLGNQTYVISIIHKACRSDNQCDDDCKHRELGRDRHSCCICNRVESPEQTLIPNRVHEASSY
jgi:hypothetical protein